MAHNSSKPAATEDKPTAGNYDNTKRKWFKPSERAKGYAEERKEKVHKFGKKKGEELSEYDQGIRSGYLLCQSDHAGMFRYKQAMDATNDKEYAKQFSREKGTKLKTGGNK